MRHFMHSYVSKSCSEDLKDIATFYSSAGAGAGSAFWVACLPQQLATPQPQHSQGSNGGGGGSGGGRSGSLPTDPSSPSSGRSSGLAQGQKSRLGPRPEAAADGKGGAAHDVSSANGAASISISSGSGSGSGGLVVVGTVALERKSAEEAELRRMSVRPGFRR